MTKLVKDLTKKEANTYINKNCIKHGCINSLKCQKCEYKIPLATDVKTHYVCGLMVQEVLNKEIEVKSDE